MPEPGVPNALVGAWRLRSFVFTDAQGDEHEPLGPAPDGSVVVTADGYLSLVFVAGGRTAFSAPDLLDADQSEKAAAAASYVSFGGPFRIEGDAVVVDVRHSFFPNWTGSEQRRRFVLDGDELTLETTGPILVNGVERWGRAALVRA